MKTAAWLLLALFLSLLLGCQPGRRTHREAAGTVTTGPAGVEVNQTGAAAKPATAARKQVRVETFIPPGVEVSAWTDGRISWKTTAPQPVATTTTDESAAGPQSFTPAAPPTPSEEADGQARLYAWLAIIIGGAAGIFGAVRAWPMVGIGGGCVAAAGVAVVALGSIPEWVWTVLSVGLVVAVAGPLIWRFHLQRERLAAAPLRG
jgi:hypothetical protein